MLAMIGLGTALWIGRAIYVLIWRIWQETNYPPGTTSEEKAQIRREIQELYDYEAKYGVWPDWYDPERHG